MTENWACIKEVDPVEHHIRDSCPSESLCGPTMIANPQVSPRRGSISLHGAGHVLHCDAM